MKKPEMEEVPRVDIPGGAVRYSTKGQGRYDLIPAEVIRRLAIIYEQGAEKYAPRNWEKGLTLGSLVDHAMRHLFKLSAGEVDEDHAGHTMWNMAAIIWTKWKIDLGDLPKELDDVFWGHPLTFGEGVRRIETPEEGGKE